LWRATPKLKSGIMPIRRNPDVQQAGSFSDHRGICDGTRMNMKRMRGRNHRGGSGGGGGGGPIRAQGGGTPLNRNHVFDSNGPDVRIRGTAQQLFEKYLQLGRDATSGGDRVTAESYFQYAEHYFRILNAMNQAAQQSGHQAHTPRPPRSNEQGTDGMSNGESEPDETEPQQAAQVIPPLIMPAGLGDQPGDTREIPIANTPPEG
jgi:hypothetical protein